METVRRKITREEAEGLIGQTAVVRLIRRTLKKGRSKAQHPVKRGVEVEAACSINPPSSVKFYLIGNEDKVLSLEEENHLGERHRYSLGDVFRRLTGGRSHGRGRPTFDD